LPTGIAINRQGSGNMLSARNFNFAFLVFIVALYSTMAMQAQSSKPAAKPPASSAKTPAPSPAASSKAPDPFASLNQFSATVTGGVSGNVDEIKVARSGKLMWYEAYNKINYGITNLETRETYFVIKQPKEQCTLNPGLAVQSFPFGFFRQGYQFERTPEGEAELDGHHCHVESYVRTSEAGDSVRVKFWEADDLKGFPLKVEITRPGGHVATITYKDVKLGPPDAALFVHPKNCLKGALPADQ
jgi:hypothetical protein